MAARAMSGSASSEHESSFAGVCGGPSQVTQNIERGGHLRWFCGGCDGRVQATEIIQCGGTAAVCAQNPHTPYRANAPHGKGRWPFP